MTIIHKQSSNWLNSFLENWLYLFSTLHGKGGKQIKILGKRINWYCPSHTGLGISWNFATITLAVCENRWQKNGQQRGRKKEIKYQTEKQNGWYLRYKRIIKRRVSICLTNHTSCTRLVHCMIQLIDSTNSTNTVISCFFCTTVHCYRNKKSLITVCVNYAAQTIIIIVRAA